MSEKIRMETGAPLISIGQLEEAFNGSGHEFDHMGQSVVKSVFLWLRAQVEPRPLLLTSDKGLKCHRVADQANDR